MQMADKKPLWEIMRDAYDTSIVPIEIIKASDPQTGNDLTDRVGIAAELRALADEVLPEESITPMLPDGYDVTRAKWEQRMATRALLLKAAAEAEGEK
jgi:hypothetical protein